MLPEGPTKQRIRQSFDQAAHSYDAAAGIQRQVCDHLAELLDHQPPTAVERWLDAGCGTGYALRQLAARYPLAGQIGLDLSPAMLAHTPPTTQRISGDVEALPLADASLDVYWSSLALQWCALDQSCREAWRVLRPAGRLAIATLGPETFATLRAAFAESDHYQHTLSFLSPTDMAAHVRAAGFTICSQVRQPCTAWYGDLRSLLQAVKAVGANQVGAGRRTGLMSRTAWQRVEAAYEQFRQPEGLPLTYDVLLMVAEK